MRAIVNREMLIEEQEVPQHILEEQRCAATYRAVLKKRFGRITANDFLKYASRFIVLCDKIYQGSELELLKDRSVPLNFTDLFAASQGLYKGEPGETLDISRITPESFRKIFKHSSSVVLDILPKVWREDIATSFAQVEWTYGRSKFISFYAQQGGRYDLPGGQRPLESLLFRKMFYVPGTAPNINFAVRFGTSARMDELLGNPF